MKKYIMSLFMMIVCLSGCSMIKMQVQSYCNPNVNAKQYQTFAVAPVDPNKNLRGIDMLQQIANELKARGYIEDNNAPSFLIVVSFNQQEKQEWVPQRTYYIPQYKPGETYFHSGSVYNGYGYGSYNGMTTSSGSWEYVPQTSGGYYKSSNLRSLNIKFIDTNSVVKKMNDNNNNLLIVWECNAVSEGSKDLYNVSPCLIKGMIDDFPEKQQDSERVINASDCARK